MIPGICVCGSGAGTFLVAPLTSMLLRQFGWRGCNRLMALLCLACSVFGLVMIPNKGKREKQKDDVKETEESSLKQRKTGLFNVSFILMTAGNIPFAMAIYISYTYLPSVSIYRRYIPIFLNEIMVWLSHSQLCSVDVRAL